MKRLTPHILASVLAAGTFGCDSDSTDTQSAEVRMTKFELGQDPGQTVYLNHRIPVSFELAGPVVEAAEEETTFVAVTFSFVEPDADPEADTGCSSSAINVALPNSGEPTTVNAFIWPTTDCAALVGEGRELAVIADFFRDEALEGAVDVELPTLQIAPGQIDIAYGLSTDSSVALIPLVGEEESRTPSLVVQSSLVFNGRDPYVAKVAPEEIPEDLLADEPDIEEQLEFGLDDAALDATDALPGTATIRYSLSPESDPSTVLDLTVGEEDGTTTDSVAIDRVKPGIAMGFAHDLYIEGDTLEALSLGGEFADETAFVVRGCMNTDFEQAHGDAEDCQEIPVELVRETGEASGAIEQSFNRVLERSVGNRRIRVGARMETLNRLDRSGAFSRHSGRISLSGRLGRSFDVTMIGAHAEAELSSERAAYDAEVVAFNQTVFSASDERDGSLTNEQEFSVDKSFRIGSLGFGFGPATIGFTIDAGGSIGLNVEDELSAIADAGECQSLLATEAGMVGCARMARTVTPNVSLTARIFGGLRLRVVRAGVEANLRLIETGFPVSAELGFGLTDEQSFLIRGGVTWDMTLRLISGNVQIVGSVGFRRFRRRFRVNLFSFSSRLSTFNLLERSMVEPLELL